MFSDGHVRVGILVAIGICGGPCVSCWRAAFSFIDSVISEYGVSWEMLRTKGLSRKGIPLALRVLVPQARYIATLTANFAKSDTTSLVCLASFSHGKQIRERCVGERLASGLTIPHTSSLQASQTSRFSHAFLPDWSSWLSSLNNKSALSCMQPRITMWRPGGALPASLRLPFA